jgi:hypothetical protein
MTRSSPSTGIKTIEQWANWKYARRARALVDLADTDK